MKKILSVLLVLTMALFAVSCTSDPVTTTPTPEATNTEVVPDGTTPAATPSTLTVFAMKGPTGIGMAILSKDLLNIMYGMSDSISISATVMTLYGCFTFIMAAAQPLINMLQAIGRADIPMKSVSIAAVVKVIINFILIGIPGINIMGAIVGTFCFYLITVSVNLNALIKETGVRLSYKSVFFKPLFCALMCGFAAWAVSGLCRNFIPAFEFGSRVSNDTVSAVIGIIAAVIVYVLALLFSKTIVKEDVKMLPKGEKICKVLEKYDLIG